MEVAPGLGLWLPGWCSSPHPTPHSRQGQVDCTLTKGDKLTSVPQTLETEQGGGFHVVEAGSEPAGALACIPRNRVPFHPTPRLK